LLVIALPLAFLAEIGHWGEVWVFTLSAIRVIPWRYMANQPKPWRIMSRA
jgi:hypothetical protein